MWFALIVMAFSLFLVYWVIVGSIFASLSFIRNMKLKKARFGCLFSVSALICAIFSTYGGYFIAKDAIETCVEKTTVTEGLPAAFVSCSMFSISLASIIGFFLLFFLGGFSLLVSRSWNQSWIDHELEDEDGGGVELKFKNL